MVASLIATVWLTGTAGAVANTLLVVAMLVTAVTAFFLWFASTQREVPPPTDPFARPPRQHRRRLLLLALAPLGLCLLGHLARSAADSALWGRVTFTAIALVLGAVLIAGDLYRARVMREVAEGAPPGS